MNEANLRRLLADLLRQDSETELVEFKEAKTTFDSDDLGKYFSALCNEANLKNVNSAWFILGVEDETRRIVGTRYRPSRASLDQLKYEVAVQTTNRVTFTDIHELKTPEGRVLFFQIPPAPRGMPVAWKGHYYGRDGESLGALNIHEIETIRGQVVLHDWSAQICHGATIDDLDPRAIEKARTEYKVKHRHLNDQIDLWDDATFLNKARLTVRGKITRSAIVLLGKEESEHLLSPYVAKISWILKDDSNKEIDYEHFGPPFILKMDLILAKIRNLNYRYLPNHTLFPVEVTQYEAYVIREALHNCIAHQDYELGGRINIVERPGELIFTNLGSFIPGSVEAVIEQDAPQAHYRNKLLADAMVNLNIIDIIGSGIKKMFTMQKDRYFPLPDYDLSDPGMVTVKIFGRVLNENYTRILIENAGMDLMTVMALDKVQKQKPLTKTEISLLRKQHLVEGRVPNLFVTAKVAAVTGTRASYIKNRAFDDDHYKQLILEFLREYRSASKNDIDDLLMDKLSNILSDQQKKNKIRNLLTKMSKKDMTIENTGSHRKSKWILRQNVDKQETNS